jgi:hypothetical protein
LRLTFFSAIAVFVVVNALVLPVQLPNLRRREVQREEGDASRAQGDIEDDAEAQ